MRYPVFEHVKKWLEWHDNLGTAMTVLNALGLGIVTKTAMSIFAPVRGVYLWVVVLMVVSIFLGLMEIAAAKLPLTRSGAKPNIWLTGIATPRISFDQQQNQWRQNGQYDSLAKVLHIKNVFRTHRRVGSVTMRAELTYIRPHDSVPITIGPLAWINTSANAKEIGINDVGELILAHRTSQPTQNFWDFILAPGYSYNDLLSVPMHDFTFCVRIVDAVDGWLCRPEIWAAWKWDEHSDHGISPHVIPLPGPPKKTRQQSTA